MQQLVLKFVALVGLIVFVSSMIGSFSKLVELTNEHEIASISESKCKDDAETLFNECAVLNTSRVDDLRVQDELVIDLGRAPGELALAIRAAGTYQPASTSSDSVLVPVGTKFDLDSSLYIATGEGWLGCEDYVTYETECSMWLEPIQLS
jgi:hypothetical protein